MSDVDMEKFVKGALVRELLAPMPPEEFLILESQQSSAPTPRKPSDDERYARQVFETAVYLVELAISNGGGGHSVALQLISPSNITGLDAPRNVLSRVKGASSDGFGDVDLLEVSRWIAELDGDGCAPAPYRFSDVEHMVRERCEWWQPQAVRRLPTDSEDDFSYALGLMACARYLYRIFAEGIEMGGGHSRLDLFVRQSLRESGVSRKLVAKSATGERVYVQDEHAVPCAFIRDNCLRYYAGGASVAQIAKYIGRHMVIVKLLKEESENLDASPRNGGFGLKTTMPDGWRAGVDSIFARLHAANIEFTPPAWFVDN